LQREKCKLTFLKKLLKKKLTLHLRHSLFSF